MADSGWDKGFGDLIAGIDEVDFRAGDVSPVLKGAYQKKHLEQMKKAFDTQGGSTKFGTWKPQKQPRGRILHRTGDLRSSYTNPSHADYVFKVDTSSVVAGSRHKLAIIHQNGANLRGGGRIEPRKLDKSERQLTDLDDIVWKYITEGEGGR
jgi:phage gpG-like protein